MLNSIIVMDPVFVNEVYTKDMQKKLAELTNIVSDPISKVELLENLELLKDVDVIFSGWGGPKIDQNVIDHAPNLKMVFYAAGTIKSIVTKEFWNQGIRITTANSANAIPVAEFTLACTILGLKNTIAMQNMIKNDRTYPKPGTRNIKGGFKPKVGLISLGAIAQYTLKLFKNFDYEILAFDPFISENDAQKLGVKLVDLDTIFKESAVVSLHTPLLDSTRGMIKKTHFLSMKENSTFINTARGAVVNEIEMIEALQSRNDITAFLDVVHPEPPAIDSPLYEMDNIFLTPHIAGSEGSEVARMGQLMLDEFQLYLDKKELEYEVSKKEFERMA